MVKAWAQNLLEAIVSQIHAAFTGGRLNGTGANKSLLALKDWWTTTAAGIEQAADTLEAITAPGNVVLSPNFEFPGITRFPYGAPAPGVAYTTAQHALGARSLQITTTAGSQGLYLAGSQKSPVYTVKPGDMYDAGIQVLANSANPATGSVELVLRFLNNGSLINDFVGSSVGNGGLSAWTTLTAAGTVPDGCDGMQVFVTTSSDTPSGNVYYLDAAYVREKTKIQQVIDNIHAAIDGDAALLQQNPDTVAYKLKQAWAHLVDGLSGNSAGTTTSALPSDVYTAAGNISSNATATSTALFGTPTPGTTILSGVLPNDLKDVGYGLVMRSTSTSVGFVSGGMNQFGLYDNVVYEGASSSDFTVTTDSYGWAKIGALKTGWYAVENSLGVAPVTNSLGHDYHGSITPVVLKNGAPIRLGTQVHIAPAIFSTTPAYTVHNHFSVYMEAGDYLTPGCYVESLGSGWGAITAPYLQGDAGGTRTYFAVSLVSKKPVDGNTAYHEPGTGAVVAATPGTSTVTGGTTRGGGGGVGRTGP